MTCAFAIPCSGHRGEEAQCGPCLRAALDAERAARAEAERLAAIRESAAQDWARDSSAAEARAERAEAERDELRAALVGLRSRLLARASAHRTLSEFHMTGAHRLVAAFLQEECDGLTPADLAAQYRAEVRRAALLEAAQQFVHAATYDGTTVIARLRALAAKETP